MAEYVLEMEKGVIIVIVHQLASKARPVTLVFSYLNTNYETVGMIECFVSTIVND